MNKIVTEEKDVRNEFDYYRGWVQLYGPNVIEGDCRTKRL